MKNKEIRTIYDTVVEAKKEAIKRRIEANTIMISPELAYSFYAVNGKTFPMICGMKAVVSDELPENVSFALINANTVDEIESLRKENESLKEKLNKVLELIEDFSKNG